MRQVGNKNTIELYKLVEHATHLVRDLQTEVTANGERIDYLTRRSDRRSASPKRLAKIWSEGALQEAERAYDMAREGNLPDEASGGKKRRGRKNATDPIDRARDGLFRIWEDLRADPGFKNATKVMRKSVRQAEKDADKFRKHGNRLELMLSQTIDATRDMKQAMSHGIRQVPLSPVLAPGSRAPFEEQVRALMDTSQAALNRATPERKQAPAPGVNPNPRGGAGGGGDDGGSGWG